MIGIVLLEGSPPALVGGLPLPVRTLLQMQALRVSSLAVRGAGADAWVRRWAADDRFRLALSTCDDTPAEPFVALRGDVLFDAPTLRALLAAPAFVVQDGEVLAAHRGAGHVGAFLDPTGLEGRSAAGCRRIRSADDARAATGALLESLRKPQDGIVSRALNRRLSLAVTRVLCGTGLRPNTLSVAILAIGAAGAWLASRGTLPSVAIGGVLFQAQSVLDGCDGELARMTFRGSKAGEWIDTVGDDLTNYGFFAGLACGLGRAGLGAWATAAGIVGVGAGLVASAVEYRYLLAHGTGDLTKYPLGFGDDAGEDPGSGLRGLLARARPLFKRDFFVFATMIATSFGFRTSLGMLVLFAIGAVATLVAVLRSEWSRRAPASQQPEAPR